MILTFFRSTLAKCLDAPSGIRHSQVRCRWVVLVILIMSLLVIAFSFAFDFLLPSLFLSHTQGSSTTCPRATPKESPFGRTSVRVVVEPSNPKSSSGSTSHSTWTHDPRVATAIANSLGLLHWSAIMQFANVSMTTGIKHSKSTVKPVMFLSPSSMLIHL